jgi:hypothetical protein
MIKPLPSPLELMRMHVEALFTHNERLCIESVNQPDDGVAPRFFLGRTIAGNLWRFRSDLPGDLVIELKKLCHGEPEMNEISRTPEGQKEYIRLLEAHRPVKQVLSGPAYWVSKDVAPCVQPVEISETNADLLRGGFEDLLEDVPHRRPFMAMLEDDHAVSVCASVRITDAAHEAGVKTLPAYRQKGHATNVVAGWANAVRKISALPLYSTSWDNTASQNVAARLGLPMFGVDFHIT